MSLTIAPTFYYSMCAIFIKLVYYILKVDSILRIIERSLENSLPSTVGWKQNFQIMVDFLAYINHEINKLHVSCFDRINKYMK